MHSTILPFSTSKGHPRVSPKVPETPVISCLPTAWKMMLHTCSVMFKMKLKLRDRERAVIQGK